MNRRWNDYIVMMIVVPLCLLFVAVSPTFGQVKLPDLSHQHGIKAGDFKFWPRVAVEGGYDSNVFFLSEKDINPVSDSPLLVVSPGIRIENPEFDEVHLQFDTKGEYRQYFSGVGEIDDGQSNFGVDITAIVGFYEKRDASVRLFDVFRHKLDRPNYSTDQNLNHIVNKSGVRFSLHPGGVEGRRALEVAAEYSFEFTRFLDVGFLDQDDHQIRLLGNWKFLPKTSAVFMSSLSFRNWAEGDAEGARVDSMPFRIWTGLNGYITRKIATRLLVGYGQGFYETGVDFQSVIGTASLSYTPLRSLVLTLGYKRDFADSYHGNFYGFDKIYVDGTMRFKKRIHLTLNVGTTFLQFASYIPPTLGGKETFVNMSERAEESLDVMLRARYSMVRYLDFQLTYRLQHRFSVYEIRDISAGADPKTGTFCTPDVPCSILDAGGFSRHELIAGVTVHY